MWLDVIFPWRFVLTHVINECGSRYPAHNDMGRLPVTKYIESATLPADLRSKYSEKCRKRNDKATKRQSDKAVPQKYISRCVGKIKKMQLWKSVKARWKHIRGLSHLSSLHDTTRCSATHDSAVLAWTSLADRNVCVAACAHVPVCVRLPLMLPQGLSKSARWIMCSLCVTCAACLSSFVHNSKNTRKSRRSVFVCSIMNILAEKAYAHLKHVSCESCRKSAQQRFHCHFEL